MPSIFGRLPLKKRIKVWFKLGLAGLIIGGLALWDLNSRIGMDSMIERIEIWVGSIALVVPTVIGLVFVGDFIISSLIKKIFK